MKGDYGPSGELVLRYLKHRWRRDVEDLLQASAETGRLQADDIDLDVDMQELGHAVSAAALAELAAWLLGLRAPLPAEHPALRALAPELDPPRAALFLQLVALNLAFRLRSDALLSALCAWTAEGPQPRLAPAALGALLIRARSARAAAALLQAAPLDPAARAEALAAATPPPSPPAGARLHVEAPDHETVLAGLCAALNGVAHPPLGAPPRAQPFMLLRRRGGFVSVLGVGDQVPEPLARDLAGKTGISRVIRAAFPGRDLAGQPTGALELLVLEGRRVALDTAGLAARVGAPLEPDDVAGELRALGVLDLDPGHVKGRAELRWTEATRGRPRGSRGVAIA